jgi:hypothetical protein
MTLMATDPSAVTRLASVRLVLACLSALAATTVCSWLSVN